jgi:hypothetical protein
MCLLQQLFDEFRRINPPLMQGQDERFRLHRNRPCIIHHPFLNSQVWEAGELLPNQKIINLQQLVKIL